MDQAPVQQPGDGQRFSGMRSFLRAHWQTLFNVYLFINFAGWFAWQIYLKWAAGGLDYVEIAFAVHSAAFVTVVLVRKHHKAIERNIFKQMLAGVAFYSGALFIGQPSSGGPIALHVSQVLIFAANVLAVLCLANLGRNFGILIAYRGVESHGLYAMVRHPMYATDILLRAGYLVSHFNWTIGSVLVISSACYIYRALLEERFLSKQPEYRDYMEKVRYRFIPGVV